MNYLFCFLALLLCTAGISQPSSRDSILYWPQVRSFEQKVWGNFHVEYKKALDLHQKILASACFRCQARSFYIIGKFEWADGAYDSAMMLLHTSVKMASGIGEHRTVADALDLIAVSYYYQGYYDSALQYYARAESIYKAHNDIDAMIIISNNISLVHHRKGDYQNAIRQILETEKLKDLHKKQVAELDRFAGMGAVLIDSLYYKEEIEDIKRDLNNHIAEKDSFAVYRSYFNLANAYAQMRRYHQAIRAQVKGNKVMKSLRIMPYYNEVATYYRQLEMKDSCFYFHQLAVSETSRMRKLEIVYMWERIGDSHFHFGNYDSATVYFEKAIALNSLLNNRITVAGIRHRLADALLRSWKVSEARDHVESGIPLAKQVSLSHLVSLYAIGSKVYEHIGDYRKAMAYKNAYALLKDSINKQETTLELVKLQTQFQTAKRIGEIQDLQEQNALHELEAEARNLQITIAVILLVVFSAAGVLLYSRYKQKQRSNEHLEAQKRIIEHQNEILKRTNAEKEILLSEIHHRVKNNLQIISSLINLKSKSTSAETNDILFQLNGRILSMGLIHERLYNNKDIQRIRIDEYLIELAQTLVHSASGSEDSIQLKFDVDAIVLKADSALTFGLICNELITNSIKYAFTEDQSSREISFSLKATKEDLQIRFVDNGTSPRITGNIPPKSFGLKFVDQLVRAHLSGQWNYFLDDGFQANIVVPLTR